MQGGVGPDKDVHPSGVAVVSQQAVAAMSSDEYPLSKRLTRADKDPYLCDDL